MPDTLESLVRVLHMDRFLTEAQFGVFGIIPQCHLDQPFSSQDYQMTGSLLCFKAQAVDALAEAKVMAHAKEEAEVQLG